MNRLLPDLPGMAWAYLLTRLVPAFGNGLALPFVLIYLHDVRGLSLGTAGLVWGLRIILMIIGSFTAGTLIDRRGPVGVSLVGLALTAAGWLILAFAASVPLVIVAAIVGGVGSGVIMPTNGAIVGRFITQRLRHTVFSLQFGMFNLGIALGAAVSGLIAETSQPRTYTLLFVLTALSNAPTAAFNAYVGRRKPAEGAPAEARPPHAQTSGPQGYVALMRDSLVARLVLASFAYFLAGEAIWTIGIGPYLKDAAGFPEASIGLLFTANTVAVFFFQFVVSRWAEGRARLRVLASGYVVSATAFVGVVIATRLLVGTPLFLALVVVAVVIAAGECAAPPVLQPLLLDAVPPELQGRAMALVSKGQTVGMASGTMVVGLLLALSADALWIAAALVLLATAAMLLTTFVSPEHRLVLRASES